MVQHQALAELAARLQDDFEAGLQLFRQQFFDALECHTFSDCQTLLERLAAAPAPRGPQEYRYHRAVLWADTGEFDQAETLLRSLLAETLLPDLQARTSLELGYVLDEISQWDEAESYYRLALTQFQANGNQLGQAKTLNNLGVLLRFQVEQFESGPQRLQDALACHERALTLAHEVNDLWEIAKNWHGKGMVYGLLQQYEEAEIALQTHLKLCQAQANEHHEAIGLYDLAALVYQPQERWHEAKRALEQAIAILERYEDDANLAEALTRRGNVQVRQGQVALGLASYAQAMALAETVRIRLTTPTAQAGNRAMMEAIYRAPLTFHLRQRNGVEAFDQAERARARVLADLLDSQPATPHVALPADLLGKRDTIRHQLDQAYAGDSWSAEFTGLERTLADIDRQIDLLDPAYSALTAIAPLTSVAVQQRLPAGSALLTYVSDDNDQIWIVVLSQNTIHVEPIPKRTMRWLRGFLADHLDGHRRGILVPDPNNARLMAPRALLLPLYQSLLEPVMALLETAHTVYIIPTGPLHYLPIAALTPDPNRTPPLLTGGRRIVYAPSATVLLNYCHTRTPSAQQGTLAVAPDDAQLRMIQGAAKALAQGKGKALIGSHATRQTFLAEAPHYRSICFLGHGYFDRRYAMSSRLQFSDGHLYASEILRDLRMQADLVVLAACETGRGQILRGDEILGLTRTMLYAGTPSVLVTLWPVHEIPTRLLVERLFAELTVQQEAGNGFDPAGALAKTQEWLRTLTFAEAQAQLHGWPDQADTETDRYLTALWQMTKSGIAPQSTDQLFNHPFFWSPYILVGDRPPNNHRQSS